MDSVLAVPHVEIQKREEEYQRESKANPKRRGPKPKRGIGSDATSLLIVVLLLSLTALAATKIPDSAWQTGTLRNVTSDSHSKMVGAYNNGHGVLTEKVRTVTHYTIEAPQYIYQADRLTNQHDKPLDVTINGPVKFAVVGTDMYLNDDTGKSHKLTVATKTLRTPPPDK